MRCDAARELLPDYALGTTSEVSTVEVRRHLRGCAACRLDAEAMDRGLVTFAGTAHQTPPPAELKERVLNVLDEEWAEGAPAGGRTSHPWGTRVLAVAASVALVAALLWGFANQRAASRAEAALGGFRSDAAGYRQLLTALGGRDVRVANLSPAAYGTIWGTAVLYDAHAGGGQSWVLVLCRGWTSASGEARVTLLGRGGRSITLPRPMTFDSQGYGSALLVTSADLSGFSGVRVSAPDGAVLASGVAAG